MRSMPTPRHQRRFSSSFSVMAGRETGTPGRLMPLWSETAPGTMHSQLTSVSVTDSTFSETLPSSMRMTSPGLQSPGRPLNVVETRSWLPMMSSMVMVNLSPRLRMILPLD